MLQYFELQQLLGTRRQAQPQRVSAPSVERLTIPDKPVQPLAPDQQHQVEAYHKKGILFDPVKMALKRIDPQTSN